MSWDLQTNQAGREMDLSQTPMTLRWAACHAVFFFFGPLDAKYMERDFAKTKLCVAGSSLDCPTRAGLCVAIVAEAYVKPLWLSFVRQAWADAAEHYNLLAFFSRRRCQ